MYEHVHVRTVGLCSPYLFIERHISQLQNDEIELSEQILL